MVSRASALEGVGRADEQVGLAGERLEPAAGSRRLQNPQRRRANRDHPAAAAAAGDDLVDRFLREVRPFGVHPMLGQRIGLDRAKRARPDV